MAALGLIALGLALQQRAGSDSAITGLATNGPFHASVDAAGVVQLGPAVTALRPGDQFGWTSRFCAPATTRLLIQARLVHLPTHQALLYREHILPTDAQGCTTAAWQMALPTNAPPGAYQVQRFLLLTPANAAPRTHILPPITLDVLAAP
jgi:hypothetical protein